MNIGKTMAITGSAMIQKLHSHDEQKGMVKKGKSVHDVRVSVDRPHAIEVHSLSGKLCEASRRANTEDTYEVASE